MVFLFAAKVRVRCGAVVVGGGGVGGAGDCSVVAISVTTVFDGFARYGGAERLVCNVRGMAAFVGGLEGRRAGADDIGVVLGAAGGHWRSS